MVVLSFPPGLKKMFGSMPNTDPRQPNKYSNLLHMPLHNSSVEVSTSTCSSGVSVPIKRGLFVPVRSGRSVGPFGPRK